MSLIESCTVVFVVNTLVYTRIQAIAVKGLSAIHASNKLTDVSRHEAKLRDRRIFIVRDLEVASLARCCVGVKLVLF